MNASKKKKDNAENKYENLDHEEIVQRLHELKELRNRGIINDAEYEKKRRPLVALL
jgi:cytochrome c-type biogenesis protein CcmH/NrfG